MSRMRRAIATIWLPNRALRAMTEEAERTFPNETGGVLMGYWSASESEVVVTHVIGPGPLAVHEAVRFTPDADYQEQEISRWYLADALRHTYLGDWHSHPEGGTTLSPIDYRTLCKIASYEMARAPTPLMAVLSLNGQWSLSVWRYQKPVFWPFCFGQRVSLLEGQPFDDEPRS
jgi:integrative and conjugative element protein (TIGR02256 family)